MCACGQRAAELRQRDPRRPQDIAGLDGFGLAILVPEPDGLGRDVVGHGLCPDLDVQLFEHAFGGIAQTVVVWRQDVVRALDQNHAGVTRINLAEIADHHPLGQIAQRPGQLHAGGSAANDDKGQQLSAQRRIAGFLRFLEGAEQPVAHFQGVFHRLEAGGMFTPVVIAEVLVFDAGGGD